jgi:hypothetical protein
VPCRYYSAVIIQPNNEDVGESLVSAGCAAYAENCDQLAQSVKRRLLENYNNLYNNQALGFEEDDDEERGEDGEVDFDQDDWDIGDIGINYMRGLLGMDPLKNGFKHPVSILNESVEAAEEQNDNGMIYGLPFYLFLFL